MERSEIKILLIDDEKKILERMQRSLSKEGYEIDIADNGETGIKKLQQNDFDIVITDLNMPGKNGFEVMEFMSENTPNTLPLVITGYASVAGAIQAMKHGAYDFIEKPVDTATLKMTVQRAVERVILKKENLKNITELKKLNELKNEFLSVVSHDLRSPLSTIGGYANYLIEKGDLSETQTKYLNIIKDIADNLYLLVNELLDISKIEGGIIHLNKEETDIVKLINTSINNFLLLAIDKNNTIEYYNKLKDPIVKIDKIKINQVINNLISNAIKFTENGKITVSTKSQDSKIAITLEDTGVGISKNEIERIIGGYTYFHKKGTRGEKGTGLGLIICKRFIELHGGRIKISSKVGKGSRFEVIIPPE